MADYPDVPKPIDAANPSHAVTETYVTVTAVSAAGVAANLQRRFLGLFNNDASVTMTFSFAATAVALKGIVLAPGASRVFDGTTVPTGAVKVIGSGTATVQATFIQG